MFILAKNTRRTIDILFFVLVFAMRRGALEQRKKNFQNDKLITSYGLNKQGHSELAWHFLTFKVFILKFFFYSELETFSPTQTTNKKVGMKKLSPPPALSCLLLIIFLFFFGSANWGEPSDFSERGQRL